MDLAEYIPQVPMPEDRPGVVFERPTEGHAEELNDFFCNTFGVKRPVEHWLWKFCRNPAGPVAGVVAREESTRRIIGTGIGQPRDFVVGGKPLKVLNNCENAVAESHRAGGRLFSELAGGLTWWAPEYGCPFGFGGQTTRAARVVGKRLGGYEDLFTLRPWECRLSSAPGLGKRWGRLGRLAGHIRDWGVSLPKAHPSGARVSVKETVDQEFDVLWNRLAQDNVISGVRDAAFLRWRWEQCPVARHVFLLASDAQGPCGFMVVRLKEEDGLLRAYVVDWHVGTQVEVFATLFVEAAQLAHQLKVDYLFVHTAAHQGLDPILERLSGLAPSTRLELDHVVGSLLWAPDLSEEKADQLRTLLNYSEWHYTQGDSDYQD